MTQVCAPVKKWPQSRPADLYEFTEGSYKYLFDQSQKLRFIDVDWKEKSPSTKEDLIISYHNFQETPDLEKILSEMQAKHPSARYYKLATFAKSTLDSLRMLHFQRKHPNVIGLCMGDKGSLTRILAPIMGCPITYAPLTESDKNAPGQLLWSELSTIYHFRALRETTRIYGLIGDPVSQSIGHLFHNDQFREHHIDAVYVKMSILPAELSLFFEAIKNLPFFGLSVTAPLKELVIPYLRTLSKAGEEIGAVNTVCKNPSGWEGANTDSTAAADVLGQVKGKKVVILGAGGAAKAIAYELMRRKAVVTIVNRTLENGKIVAQQLGCDFSETVPPYDILINATASSHPHHLQTFAPSSTVMDIAIRTTPFLIAARSQGCRTLDGLPMYFNQALAQQILFRQTKYLRSIDPKSDNLN